MKSKNDVKFIDELVHGFWHTLSIDRPDNHDDIVKFIVDDVDETADPKEWHSGDVDIAFRRWIEAQQPDPEK